MQREMREIKARILKHYLLNQRIELKTQISK